MSSAQLTDVTASGFADFGVQLVESATVWEGGGASANLGTGLIVHGGSATLSGLDLSDGLQGLRLMPPYAGVFAASATVRSSAITVNGGEGFGLLHDSSSVQHDDLVAQDNAYAALWVQHCPSFALLGSGSVLSGNGLAGVALVDTESAEVEDVRIEASYLVSRSFGLLGMIDVGDGVHIADPAGPHVMSDLTLLGNERTGILLDLGGGSTELVTFDRVTVDGTGEQLGVVAQSGTIVDDWDGNVTRQGTTIENDSSFEGSLDRVEPLSAGGEAYPEVTRTVVEGIAGIIGDCC